MLIREDHYMIKHFHQIGMYLVDIAHRIGCCEKTVSRHLSYSSPPTGRAKKKQLTKLDPFKEYIDSRLKDNVWNSSVIFQELKEKGYSGGCAILKRYIQPKRPLRQSKSCVRFETDPGYQLQHDWGETEAEVAGKLGTINFAVNTLGYSRRFHVFAAPSQDAEHTYESMVRSFNYFGGSVKKVLVDNQKAAVLRHGRDGQVEFNAGFLQLANHYGFRPSACKVQRPQTKGKVERMVGYLKDNFFTRYRKFDSFAHINQLLEKWLAEVADQRVLREFQSTPVERFTLEQAALLPLPPSDFDTSYLETRKVAWDGYIEVRGNRYSLPHRWCGQMVSIRIGLDGELRVYAAEELIASHLLREASYGWQVIPEHHRELWRKVGGVEQRPLSVYEGVL